jgi:hypothetical protein
VWRGNAARYAAPRQQQAGQQTMEYGGPVYTGVVGPDTIPVQAMLSIINMSRRPGDSPPQFRVGTKGYETRQQHFDHWLTQTEYPFMLLLDHDMVFAEDTLERLRSHGKPYVSGLYMRRRWAPMAPIWFEPFEGWPYRWMTAMPERGRLHEIGASGWGCILIHREVALAVRGLLKGELDVIEDDMDVWPYDLEAVLAGRERLRPLRGIPGEPIGSDVRYPFFALHAGYPLYGDPDVRPGHLIHYPLTADDFAGMSAGAVATLDQSCDEAVSVGRAAWRAALERLDGVGQ